MMVTKTSVRSGIARFNRRRAARGIDAATPLSPTTATAPSLWQMLETLKSPRYRWVDLTHTLSPKTPHWYGFEPFHAKLLFDYLPDTPAEMRAPMRCFEYSVASQYGTHVDAPRHFWADGRALDAIGPQELVMPLCVIDKHEECA